jgi:hypothetical protein
MDSFMMMAGVVLFFTARDHLSYYTSKFVDRIGKVFEKSPKMSKYLFDDMIKSSTCNGKD